jgi:hypothetical protein
MVLRALLAGLDPPAAELRRATSALSIQHNGVAPSGPRNPTLSVCRHPADALHGLHNRTFHGNHGTVRLHTLERQSTQAHCLHLVANAIVYWNTITSSAGSTSSATSPPATSSPA